jgi:hypothetical protein
MINLKKIGYAGDGAVFSIILLLLKKVVKNSFAGPSIPEPYPLVTRVIQKYVAPLGSDSSNQYQLDDFKNIITLSSEISHTVGIVRHSLSLNQI